MNQRARAPTSRTRAAGAAALASVLVTALVVTRESSAVHGTGGPVPWSNWLSSVSLSDSCPEDAHGLMLKQATSNASFWHALHDRTALTVAPVVPVDTSYVRCIEHSIISARIRSELADSETGMPQFLMPLPPLRFSAAKGEYESALAVPHSLPPGVYELEVVLEFGRLRGAAQGNICSSDRPYCEPEEANARVLLDTHGVAMGYVGAVIDRQPLHVEEGGKTFGIADATVCRDLSSLQGFWHENSFFGRDEGRPCRLQAPRTALPKVMWINLLGDSNTRGVYAHFRDRVKQRVAVDGELVVGHTHTGATIGTWPGTETLVIITWMWWFPEGEDGGADMHWQETVDQLHKLTTISLQGFLKHSGLEGRLQQPDASRARALFRRVVEEDPGSVSRPTISAVSFGSHGPERTSEGMKAYLDLIFEKGVLQENVFFTTTTHVDAGKIPGRLRHQALVRNNAVIHALNSLVVEDSRFAGRILDVESISAGLDSPAHELLRPHPDAIHFRSPVYEAWLDLIWVATIRLVSPAPVARA